MAAGPRRSARLRAKPAPPASPSPAMSPAGRGHDPLREVASCPNPDCGAIWPPGSISYSTYKRFCTICSNGGKRCCDSPSYANNASPASWCKYLASE